MPVHPSIADSAPHACENLETKSSQRKFVFAEFFAGMGGFSATMRYLAGDLVTVSATLDDYDGWDILNDADFEIGLQVCEEVDHAHFAPPCRTLSRSRRSSGVTTTLRAGEIHRAKKGTRSSPEWS